MFVPRAVSKSSYGAQKKKAAVERTIQTVTTNDLEDTQDATTLGISNALANITEEKIIKDTVLSYAAEPPRSIMASSTDIRAADDMDSIKYEEPIVCYSKQQRWAESGEPVCVVCGRYGEYIVDQTDHDVCSLECKAKHLHQLGLPLTTTNTEVGKKETEAESDVKGVVPTKNVESIKDNSLVNAERICEGWTYREYASIAAMTDGQVEAIRNKYSVSVRGEGAPRLITEFSHLGLPTKVFDNLKEGGYVSPTPVQMQTIPAALSGRDLLVCATTGSGKTLSFLLPLLLSVLGSSTPQTRGAHPRALVLTPTRELAMQIESQAKEIMRGVPMMRTALIVGGVSVAQQLHRLRSGVQIVIATPARLNDIIMHHTSDIELMDVEILVVDEVDCLLQMGFENQFCEIEEILPRKRQNLMFSATIPRRIEKMASELMNNPLFISIGQSSVPCDSIKHTVIWVEENSKRKKLLALLDDPRHFRPPAVVFVSSKMGALLLADALCKTRPHLSTVGIHGDMAQERRSEILSGCLEGKYSVVVATNVLGRGLDLVSVKQVIIFDMPTSITEFIHQVGRSGRQSSPGSAYTFVNNSNQAVFMDLTTLLGPQGTQLPPQLTGSPHLRAQLDKRKRLSEKGPGAKRQKTGAGCYQDSSYRNKESLIEMIKASSKKRKT